MGTAGLAMQGWLDRSTIWRLRSSAPSVRSGTILPLDTDFHGRSQMVHVGPIAMVIAGLALLDGSIHLPIPAAAWIGLLLILHGSRSLPAIAMPPALWL